MFAGHLGAGFAIGRFERKVNVGLFVFAAMLIDLVLWCFVLFGWETVVIPPDYAITRQVEFSYPFSHGLIAAAAWSVLAGTAAYALLARLGAKRLRAAILMTLAVFSHWLLDALVHIPDLPLAGAGSPKIGLGLWNHLAAALVIESCILLAGLFFFLPGSGLSRGRKTGLVLLALLVLVFTIVGMTVAPPPPSVQAMAISSLVMIVVVSAHAAWLGKRPKGTAAPSPR
jgi:hypothetical protein